MTGARRPRASGREAARARGARRTPARRPSRRQARRRRVTALLVVVALAGLTAALVFRFVLAAPPDFTGTWAGSDAALGSTRWRISSAGDAVYRVKGMRVDGRPVTRLRLEGDELVAGGRNSAGAWTLTVHGAGGGNQVVAVLETAGGPGRRCTSQEATDQ